MKTFLKVDYYLQTLLLTLMGVTLPFIFIPLFLLIVFGGWQLISGAITGFFYKKLNRKKYLIKALSYLFFLFFSYQLTEMNILPDFLNDSAALALFFWLIIPLAIGIWYYVMVNKDYRHYCKEKVVKCNTVEMNSPLE